MHLTKITETQLPLTTWLSTHWEEQKWQTIISFSNEEQAITSSGTEEHNSSGTEEQQKWRLTDWHLDNVNCWQTVPSSMGMFSYYANRLDLLGNVSVIKKHNDYYLEWTAMTCGWKKHYWYHVYWSTHFPTGMFQCWK